MKSKHLIIIGQTLKKARKKHFPQDDLQAFAVRICVSRATLQKMEKGDLSVGIGKYYEAARLMGMEKNFSNLFFEKESLFD